ncbi:MAG: glycoside hydrolase family 2 protein [Bacteroidota bacterium]
MRKLSSLIAILVTVTFSHAQTDGTKVFSLDGTWDLTGYNPDKSERITLKGTVPGQVHPDLHREGLIPDPFWRDNAEQCQWPENWEWRYKKYFDLPEGFVDGEWISLQFDGIDTYADVFINGRKINPPHILSSENMFLPLEHDVSDEYLTEKGNVIEVRIYPISKYAGLRSQLHPLPGAFGAPMRPYVRRMQSSFGWDWLHRLVTAGIWRPVRLVSYQNARIDHLFFYTKELSESKAGLHVEVESTNRNRAAKTIQIQLRSPEGKVVWQKETGLDPDKMEFDFTLEDPQIWWPNGAGEQALYYLTAGLFSAEGKKLHSKTVETGIRTVSIEEIPDQEGPGSSFTMIVNGMRIFAKGGNWVPADPFPARITPEKYEQLIVQARDAGMNMLRLWGGGIYEPEAFWHACNKHGIMISVDFMLACQVYPDDDPQFVDMLKREFAANIKLTRNHPSLVFWAGDNELGLGNKPADNWPGKQMHLTMTGPLVEELDPSRPFRITSPMGNDPATNNSAISGDSHKSSYYEVKRADYRHVIDSLSGGRFMSEHPIAGTPPKQVLLKFMNEEDFYTREMLEFHTKNNPYEKIPTFFKQLERNAKNLYGDPGDDTDRWISQMEYLHYEVARLGMEGSRRRKFYTSGILLWMFNDCWPASGLSVVDYWGDRKAGWYGVAAGMRPVIAASHVEGNDIIWFVTSDLFEDKKVNIVVKVQPTNGGKPRFVKHLEITVPDNSSVEAIRLPLDEMKSILANDAVLVCELNFDETGYDRSYWTAGLPQNVVYPVNKLEIKLENNGTEGTINLKSKKWARVVNLYADGIDFEDNYFEMLPGEERIIKWRSRRGELKDDIRVSWWNDQE